MGKIEELQVVVSDKVQNLRRLQVGSIHSTKSFSPWGNGSPRPDRNQHPRRVAPLRPHHRPWAGPCPVQPRRWRRGSGQHEESEDFGTSRRPVAFPALARGLNGLGVGGDASVVVRRVFGNQEIFPIPYLSVEACSVWGCGVQSGPSWIGSVFSLWGNPRKEVGPIPVRRRLRAKVPPPAGLFWAYS